MLRRFIHSCESGETFKTKKPVFSYEDLVEFASNKSLNTPYWLVRKAIVALSYFGNLRNPQLRQLRLDYLKIGENGVEVKLRNEKKVKCGYLIAKHLF